MGWVEEAAEAASVNAKASPLNVVRVQTMLIPMLGASMLIAASQTHDIPVRCMTYTIHTVIRMRFTIQENLRHQISEIGQV